MRPEHLLRLYPRAWRKRYGEEFLATVGKGPLHLHQTVDIVAGAVDAWLSGDVRRAIMATSVTPSKGVPMMLKSLRCEGEQLRYTKRDSSIGAAVMLGAALILTMLGIAARRSGWLAMGEVLTNVSFPRSWMLSMPFWLMKGQPWKTQLVIVGGTLVLLVTIGYLSIVT